MTLPCVIIAVFNAVKAARIIAVEESKPVFIEAMTYRYVNQTTANSIEQKVMTPPCHPLGLHFVQCREWTYVTSCKLCTLGN